jgi:hypothetical protein
MIIVNLNPNRLPITVPADSVDSERWCIAAGPSPSSAAASSAATVTVTVGLLPSVTCGVLRWPAQRGRGRWPGRSDSAGLAARLGGSQPQQMLVTVIHTRPGATRAGSRSGAGSPESVTVPPGRWQPAVGPRVSVVSRGQPGPAAPAQPDPRRRSQGPILVRSPGRRRRPPAPPRLR